MTPEWMARILQRRWYRQHQRHHHRDVRSPIPLELDPLQRVFAAEVSCGAFSPVLGDYQRSSYPVAVFRWTLRNPSNRPLQLSLLLSWRNTVGWFTNTDPSAEVHFRDGKSSTTALRSASVKGEQPLVDQPGLKGVLLDGLGQPLAEGEGQWCLALPDTLEDVEVMRCSRGIPPVMGRNCGSPCC